MAIGFLLPFLTGQIKEFGNMLLPMHIPVMLCGLICGWQYGLGTGLILPILRSVITGAPILFPRAAAMSLELATYGAMCGFLFGCFKNQNLKAVYTSLVASMLSGRIVWGFAEILFLGIQNTSFTFSAFITGAFLNSIPGIIIQLVVIPIIIVALKRAKYIPLSQTLLCNSDIHCDS